MSSFGLIEKHMELSHILSCIKIRFSCNQTIGETLTQCNKVSETVRARHRGMNTRGEN